MSPEIMKEYKEFSKIVVYSKHPPAKISTTSEKTLTEVIVVDDDIDTVEVFSEYLVMKGYELVGKGYNGKDAVELYKKFKPDVVMLDIMMPEYDGFYALEKIREMDPDSRFVMVTGDLTNSTKKKLEDFKVTGLVYKPFDINEVISVIENLKKGQAVFPYRW
jgi:two-component system, chemotaxis family, chemotaxis protein CheY